MEQFIGFVSYYGTVQNFADRAFPLSELRKKVRNKQEKFIWTKKCQESFEDLKESLLSQPIRAFPILDLTNNKEVSPLILSTDYSCKGMSAILSQIQYGNERLISCASRKCTPAESNYSSVKGETRAVVFALEKYDRFLQFQSYFYIITDSAALKYLLTLKTSSKLFARWSTLIFSYPCRIVHRSGKLSINSDVLSRNQDLMDDFKLSDTQYESIHTLHITPSNMTYPFSLKEMATIQQNDRVCGEVLSWLATEQPDITQLYDEQLQDMNDRFLQLQVINDVLYLNMAMPEQTPELKLVVPLIMKDSIIRSAHCYLTGHYKTQSTLSRLRQSFYWFDMKSDVNKYISKCISCNVTQPKLDFYHGRYATNETSLLGTLCCVDLSGPHKTDNFHNKYVLVLLEMSTRFLLVEPLKNKTPQEVARAILNKWLPLFGVPAKIISDQGKEFMNSIFEKLCSTLLIQHDFSPQDQHSGNPSERVIRDLNSFFKMIGQENFASWSIFLPIFAMAHNSHFNITLGCSSFKALTGRNMLLPIELCTINSPHMQKRINIEKIIDKVLREIYISKGRALQIRQSRYKHKNLLQNNKLVWLYVAPQTRLAIAWRGPYIIVKQVGNTCYIIASVYQKTRPILVHQSRLRPCKADLTTLKNHVGPYLLSTDILAELPTEIDMTSSFSDPPDEPDQANEYDEPLLPHIPVVSSSNTSKPVIIFSFNTSKPVVVFSSKSF